MSRALSPGWRPAMNKRRASVTWLPATELHPCCWRVEPARVDSVSIAVSKVGPRPDDTWREGRCERVCFQGDERRRFLLYRLSASLQLCCTRNTPSLSIRVFPSYILLHPVTWLSYLAPAVHCWLCLRMRMSCKCLTCTSLASCLLLLIIITRGRGLDCRPVKQKKPTDI